MRSRAASGLRDDTESVRSSFSSTEHRLVGVALSVPFRTLTGAMLVARSFTSAL